MGELYTRARMEVAAKERALCPGKGRRASPTLIFGGRRIDRPGAVPAKSQQILLGQVNDRAFAALAAFQQSIEDKFAAVHAGGMVIGLLRALSRSHRNHSPSAGAAFSPCSHKDASGGEDVASMRTPRPTALTQAIHSTGLIRIPSCFKPKKLGPFRADTLLGGGEALGNRERP